jgi:hypothetical protein
MIFKEMREKKERRRKKKLYGASPLHYHGYVPPP